MKVTKTTLEGVCILEPETFSDNRGSLTKVFHKDTFIENGIPFSCEEHLYSVSKENVIRGMHFQVPPMDQAKIVYVSQGAIMDVVLDIREGSPTFGEHLSIELSAENHKALYIPSGFAHGFSTHKDNSIVVYLQSVMRSAPHEGGINLHSFGMNWNIANPIVSTRDESLPTLAEFKTPFVYKK